MKLAMAIIFVCLVVLNVSCSRKPLAVKNTMHEQSKNIENIVDVDLGVFKGKISSTEVVINKMFTSEIEDTVIMRIENADVFRYVGPNNNFEEVCTGLKDYCSPNVVEMLIREIGYINVGGNIGFIAATGEVTYSEFDEADMELISYENNSYMIRVTKYTVDRSYFRDYLYTFEFGKDGNVLITNIEPFGDV